MAGTSGPMKIKSAIFETSAPNLAGCPRLALPEFAFIGRSNVGKSSLINLLAEQRDLARVSDLPGKTQLINFFTINLNWRLVDLPGYGYAHVAKTKRADFNEAVADYIEGRENLRGVFVLIDSRLPPQQLDVDFLGWMAGTGVPFVVVFTKTDKLSLSQAQNNIAAFRQQVLAGLDPAPPVIATSAKTKTGRTAILQHIAGQLAAD
jgi:GTP-binding protein